MTTQTAVLIIACSIGVVFYIRNRANYARKNLKLMAFRKKYTFRAFERARELALMPDIPHEELVEIRKLIDIIDRPTAALGLFNAVAQGDHSEAKTDEFDRYFEANQQAAEIYVDFVYSSMMAISYIDDFGEEARSVLKDMFDRHDHDSREIISSARGVNWNLLSAPIAFA